MEDQLIMKIPLCNFENYLLIKQKECAVSKVVYHYDGIKFVKVGNKSIIMEQ